MRSRLRSLSDGAGGSYVALMFWCPGCERIDADGTRTRGLNMLPISGDPSKHPVWGFDGNLEAPTLTPSILTTTKAADVEGSNNVGDFVCHSHLVAGVFQFLSDCTHPLATQHVALPELPRWVAELR